VRVIICDDSAFMRKAISMLLDRAPGIEVIETARHGDDALEKIKRLSPDVVTLDLEMPVLDGMGVLTRLRADLPPERRPAVLVCSTLTSKGSHEALKALRLGAADVIFKDTAGIGGGSDAIRAELIAKLHAIHESRRDRQRPRSGSAPSNPAHTSTGAPASAANQPSSVLNSNPATPIGIEAARIVKASALRDKRAEILVIGSSTGGPPVLETILTALPADLPVPVVIAQHMPALFTRSLSERLDELCAIPVRHADAHTNLVPGTAYIIVGGRHGRVVRDHSGAFRLEVSDQPTEALYKPSVDELMQSTAVAARSQALALMLTGMGDDGCRGARAMRDNGAVVLAQSAETCVVYGMPRAIVVNGAAHAALPPEVLARIAASLAPSAANPESDPAMPRQAAPASAPKPPSPAQNVPWRRPAPGSGPISAPSSGTNASRDVA
jgi:two-component system chemotaxis response regulator CheB